MRGAIVDVFYGPSSHPRREGRAEVKQVIKYLGGGRYRVKCVFLGDPADCLKVREIDLEAKGGRRTNN